MEQKKNNKSLIVTIVIMTVSLILGIYGLILDISKKDVTPSSIPSVSEIIEPIGFNFDEFDIIENCDFTTTNTCEKEIGILINEEASNIIKISYEKLENNYFNLIIYSDTTELIKLEKEIGELYLLKVINKEYLNLNIKNKNENILKFYNKNGILLENGNVNAKGNIIYNEENITFDSINCNSEYKDNIFNATLTIENNVVNINYEKTKSLNESGTKCE